MIFDIEKARITFDNVLVSAIEIQEETGFNVPIQYQDKPEIGEVISFGDKTGLTGLSKGSIVLFQKYSSIKFQFNNKDYYIVKSEDIVAY